MFPYFQRRLAGLRSVCLGLRPLLAACCVAWLAGASACSDAGDAGLPPTTLVYDGERVRVFAEGEREPCGGDGLAMERSLEFFAREFGLGEMDGVADVFWLAEDSLVERTPCGVLEDAGGCFVDGERAFVVDPSIAEHELVHVYLANRAGRTHAFFEEGAAVVYGRFPDFGPPTSDLRAALQQGESLSGEHYARAGHFMSYLLDEYGPQSVGRFFVGAAGIRELAGIEPVFVDVFGVSLERFVEQYESEAPSCGSAGWNRHVECELEPLPWARDWLWEQDFALGCGGVDVVRDYSGRVATRVALQVQESSTHTLSVAGSGAEDFSDAYQVRLLRCGGCEDELSFTVGSDMGSLFGLPLEEGRYLLDVSRDPHAPPDVSVQLRTP